MSFRKLLLFCLLHFSHAFASVYSIEDYENWIHQTPPCDQSSLNKPFIREVHKLKGSPHISAEFYCENGNKHGQITFFDENGNLFSTSIKFDEPMGIAFSQSDQKKNHREQFYVWKHSHLVSFEAIPLLQSAKESDPAVTLNGLYRVNFAHDIGGTIYSFKDGVLDGPVVTISENSSRIRRLHRSRAISKNLKYRFLFTYYKDGVPYRLNELNSLFLGFYPPSSTYFISNCQPIPEGRGIHYFEKLRSLNHDLPDIDWVLDPKSSVFKANSSCYENSQPKSIKYKNRIKSFESDCYSENFSGRVVLNDENTGKFLLLGNYSNGLPDGDFIIGSSDGPSEKFLFKEGKLVEFCSTRINALDFTQTKRPPAEILADSRTLTKPPERTPVPEPKSGLLGFTIEKGTRENWAGGLFYSPDFHFKDIGGGGFVGILETLSVDEKNMLTRASVGFGWVAMIFSGFGTFGVRFHSSQISGMDLTLGLGFVGVNAYARAIYNELEKGLSGELGVKFILPLIKL